MISANNLLKPLQTQTFLDKENNARNANITSQLDQKSYYARKTKKLNEIPNKTSVVVQSNLLTSKSIVPTVNKSNDILKQHNTNGVKKALNFDDNYDLSTMCDESNYNSINSISSIPNKPQDDMMSLEKERASAM